MTWTNDACRHRHGAPDAAYTFASVSGAPTGMLAGIDGALHVLTLSGVTRISAP